MSSEKRAVRDQDVAIIGMSCRFPGADNADDFWQNLRQGVYSVSHFSDEELLAAGISAETLREPNYVKANGIIRDADKFDAGFFGFSARDAVMMDPQHRIFLECTWEALENAGYDVSRYPGVVGVYAGAGMNTYLIRNVVPQLTGLEALEQFQLMIASDKDYIATRVSFKLNLTGPSVNVQTSCSTSLVAVHLACQSLFAGENDIAIAGGIAVRPALVSGYAYREGMIYSPDGYCRAFDARAGGTVNGNGVGVLVLKKLSQALADGDTIHAVLRGTAINNDGASKRSYSAPSAEGQAGAIATAIRRAGISAEDISYVEAHGTGTIMGDPIEINGLTLAFRETTKKNGYCAIGSVKTNVGHTDVAAGMAGLIKTVQMLKHREIAPSLHFEKPNPNIDFASTPFYVNTHLKEWDTQRLPRRAGVSSFGVGGTNAHAVVEEAPLLEPTSDSRPFQLLVLSARSENALQNAIHNLETYLAERYEGRLADASYTLQVGRQAFAHRAISVVADGAFAGGTEWLRGQAPQAAARPLVFMFSGQGSQYVNMGRGLYEAEPVFREALDRCAETLLPILKLDLRHLFYPEAGQEEAAAEQLTQTSITQPALFSIEYALSQLWMSWGLRPQAMIGHSIGEYVAACLAGVMSLEDALRVVAERGRLMHLQPRGAMLAITQTEEDVQALLAAQERRFDISVINGVSAIVVSGSVEDIAALEADLTARDIVARRLQTSHAFHSFMMEEAVAPFVELLSSIPLKAPTLPYLSNVTGTWITDAEATDPAYYGRHLRQAVRFAQNVAQTLETLPHAILLEVGPGQTLASLSRRHPAAAGAAVMASTRHPNDQRADQAFALTTLGQLWMAGADIDWQAFYAGERRRRVPLPTYPFERQRYWIDERAFLSSGQPADFAGIESAVAQSTNGAHASTAPAAETPESFILAIWQQILGLPNIGLHDNFFDLGGNSLVAASLLAQIHKATGIRIPLVRFFQAPNPAALIRLLQNEGWQHQAAAQAASSNGAHANGAARPAGPVDISMIPIIEGDPARRPFFWTHGTDFANFARLMDREQPFYVMPPPGLDGKHPVYTRAEDIVAYHIDQMKRVQPVGPYIVGGYCLGGHLALNIATEMLRRGDEVGLVVLVDVLAPDYEKLARTKRRNYAERFVYHLRYGQLPARAIGKIREVVNRQRTNMFGDEELRLLQQLDDIQQKAFEFRIPEGYPGRVIAFTCSVYNERKPADSAQRWARLAPNGVTHHVIPGDHATMMREPNIDQLVVILNEALREASTAPASGG
jgi:acyl transferase domain-containing protein/thioesterase domain-containing protein